MPLSAKMRFSVGYQEVFKSTLLHSHNHIFVKDALQIVYFNFLHVSSGQVPSFPCTHATRHFHQLPSALLFTPCLRVASPTPPCESNAAVRVCLLLQLKRDIVYFQADFLWFGTFRLPPHPLHHTGCEGQNWRGDLGLFNFLTFRLDWICSTCRVRQKAPESEESARDSALVGRRAGGGDGRTDAEREERKERKSSDVVRIYLFKLSICCVARAWLCCCVCTCARTRQSQRDRRRQFHFNEGWLVQYSSRLYKSPSWGSQLLIICFYVASFCKKLVKLCGRKATMQQGHVSKPLF